MWKRSPDGCFVKMFSVPCSDSVWAVQIGIQHIAMGLYDGDIEVTKMVQYRMAIWSCCTPIWKMIVMWRKFPKRGHKMWTKYQPIFTSAGWILSSYLKRAKRKLLVRALRALATAVLVHVICCGRNGLFDLFPPAFVNSQIAQVDRLRILEQVVFGSISLCGRAFVGGLRKFEVFPQ